MFSKLTKLKFKILLLPIILFWSGLVYGYDIGPVKMHGFVSQGFSLSSGNNFLGESTSGSFDLTMGAVNFLWSPDPGIYFSTQIISRNYGDSVINEEELEIDYGLAGFDLFANGTTEIDLRLGLLKIPMGIFGKTRDIPITYSGVILPQVIYPEWRRNSFLRSKGAALEFNNMSQWGAFNFEAQFGEVRMTSSLDSNTKVPDPEFVAWKLMYNSPENMFFAGMSQMLVDIESSSNSGTTLNKTTATVYSLGFNYHSWMFTTEYLHNRYDTKSTLLNGYQVKDESISTAYSIQLEKMFTSKVSGFIRNDHKYVDRSLGKSLQNYTNVNIIGVNWRPTSSILVKAEYHNIEGGWADYTAVDNPNKVNDADRYWDLFMLQFVYSF